MNYYLLIYHVVDDYVVKRASYREEHLGLANEARNRGHLVLGGALAEPVDKAILVFCCQGPEVIEQFIQRDPYVRHGLVSKWEIRPWTVVIK
jgi:uncharacterized protein